MTSTPSSHSEGEIFTSDSEKAPQTLLPRNGITVDRHTRTTTSSSRQSRSRSPYRGHRGEKRQRDDGSVDSLLESSSRPPKLRQGNDRHLADRTQGQRSVDAELRHHERSRHAHIPEADLRYSTHNARRRRSRSRSRSPFRHSHLDSRSGSGANSERIKVGWSRLEGQEGRNGGISRNKQSVSERSKPSGVAVASKSSAKSSENQYSQIGTSDASDRSAENFRASTLGDIELGTNDLPSVVDEAAMIEERRKRREALKAKYRSQEAPLLVQALHLRTDATSSASSLVQMPKSGTPGDDEQVAFNGVSTSRERSNLIDSAEAASPQTPNEMIQSPAEIHLEQDENLANSNFGLVAGNEDEASAADYDPTIDMQEERARHDKRLMNEDMPISTGEERKVLGQQGSRAAASLEMINPSAESATKKNDAFDMFAEDDDEVDMFAEAPANPGKLSSQLKTAQSLDVNLMDNWDDSEGYYMTIPGELFESRYHVLQNLGRGMFSSVVRATDTKTNKLVAIKIVRNNDTMRKAGMKEIEILKDLSANDAEDRKHVIRLERSFEHKGHLCMVFENLSLNLREVLKKFGRDVGLNLKAIRVYAQQLFLGLTLLRKCQYLHADLKPDNILVNDARNLLKICDLGSASSIDETVTAPYLVSRFYRAPEIMLGIHYDYSIDVWSVGCTLFELYTGKILFTGRNNNAMLRSIMECRGKFPNKVLRKGTLTFQHFDDLLNFQSIEEDKLSGRMVTKMTDIKAKPVRGLKERLVPKGKRMDEQERKEVELFSDLLDKCLDLRGDKRITPSEALRHPFIARPRG